MRVTIVAESFPPDVNGVAHAVVRIAEHLHARGHEPVVVAPAPPLGARAVTGVHPYRVLRIPSVPMPRYRGLRLGLPGQRLTDAIVASAPDVVHLASPFLFGGYAARVARRIAVPSVAVYQTDIAAYAKAYRTGFAESAAWRLLRAVHNAAGRTLAPSSSAAAALVAHGIQRVWLWRHGVDDSRFTPAKRDDRVRAALAPDGEVIVGYVGRLAVEKRVELLARASRLPGVRVVVIGAGPAEAHLRRALPRARFLGERRGEQLARLYASLDVFVHTGPDETSGQSVQEALASGVPVVAPAAGGPLDLVTPGRTGLLVPPRDGSALAAAVAALAADPALRRAFGAAGRAAVHGRTWAAVGDELIAHYQALRGVGEAGAPRPRPHGGRGPARALPTPVAPTA